MKFIGILLLMLTSVAQAQHYNIRSFSYEQGLNTYNIQKVIQDKYGFLWIATQDGLYRYNGSSFQVLKKFSSSAASLQANFVADIHDDGNGSLYAVQFNGGVDRVNEQTLAVTNTISGVNDPKKKLPNQWLRKIISDRHGNLWIGGRDYLAVYAKKEDRLLVFKNAGGSEQSLGINCIVETSDSTVCVGVNQLGLMVFNSRTFEYTINPFFGDAAGGIENSVYHVFADGAVLYATNGVNLFSGRIRNDEWETISSWRVARPNEFIYTFTRERSGDFWFGTNDGILKSNGKFNGNSATPLSESLELLKGNSINDLFIDNQNNLWVSSSKMLYAIPLQSSPFKAFTGSGGEYRMDHVYSLVPQSSNKVFAAGTNGLYLTDINSGYTEKIRGTGSLGINHHIIKIKEHIWFLSTSDGMYAFNDLTNEISRDYVIKSYPEWIPFIRNYFNASFRKDSIIYWASEEQEGLLKWDMRNRSIKRIKNNGKNEYGLPENHIHNLRMDKEQNLWLLGDRTLAKFNIEKDSVIDVITAESGSNSPNSGIFFDSYDDGKKIWFGTYGGGINVFDKKDRSWSALTEANGLTNNSVYSILPENDTFFWVSTNRGLSRINKISKRVTNYYEEDGLQDNGFDELSATKLGNRLYFGGINGFTQVDLHEYRYVDKKFPLYIYRVNYVHKNQKYSINQLSWSELNLPAGSTNIAVYIAALSFPESSKVRLYYALNGDSVVNHEVENNTILMSAPGPGNHSLTIKYFDEQSNQIVEALKLGVNIKPFWYQSNWFKVVLVLAICAVFYSLYLLRIAYIKKQHEIRKGIAADLHDDLGGTLNSIQIYSALAEKASDKQEHFQQIRTSLKQASIGLRDMIWILDDKRDTIAELFERLQQFAVPLARACDIEMKFVISSETGNVLMKKTEKRGLLLIMKEAINNSIKYSGGKQITVTFTKKKRKSLITITDDGNGFSMETARLGNGIRNMKERAHQIHYEFSIDSNGSGTIISLTSL